MANIAKDSILVKMWRQKANMTQLQVFACPDRTDCETVNGDAILMAGYLCHACIPNPCKYQMRTCLDLYQFTCTPGFECPSEPMKAKNRSFCGTPTTRTTSTSTSTTSAFLTLTTRGMGGNNSGAQLTGKAPSTGNAAMRQILFSFALFYFAVHPH